MSLIFNISTTTLRHAVLRLLLLIILYYLPLWCLGKGIDVEAESNDSIVATSLEEVEISAYGRTPVARGGSMEFDTKDFYTSMRIMGEADPLNYIKRLSGVATAGDYGSGLMIDGAHPSQTLFRINGTPIFFPYRFGGIFSTFNGAHFSKLDFERGIHKGSMPNRLGSKIDFFNSRVMPEKFSGNINVGMMSSSLTLDIPVSNKFRVTLSGRISYVDQLYGPFFKGSMDLSYQFGDLNFNAQWYVNDKNIIEISAFGNKDKLKYADTNYAMNNVLTWSNRVLSLNWIHTGKIEMNHKIHYSGFSDNYEILLPQLTMESPASMGMLGIAGDFSNWFSDHTLNLSYGYELNGYKESPQRISLTGYNRDTRQERRVYNPVEARIYGDVRLPVGSLFKFYGGVSLTYYKNQGYGSFETDPRITFNITCGPGAFNLHLGKYTQYLHQVGFSQIGLASDFWIAANKEIPKQSSYDFDIDYTGSIKNLSFSVTGYVKRVLSEPDYIGQVLDLLEADYAAYEYIHLYSGFNTGVNVIAKYAFNKINVMAGGGYGIARRKDKSTGKWIRGNTEPGFTINADADYTINRHWILGARFRFSSGRPYTPIVGMYMIAGNLIKEYGVPNSALFPNNHQLDLSATWKTESHSHGRKLTHLVNLSVINAYGHRNVEIMTYTYKVETGNIQLRKVYSLYRFLPSLSYTLQF